MTNIVNRMRLEAEDLHLLNPASETVKCLSLGADEIERLRGLDADRCRVTNSYIIDNARLAEQLTASQSREEKLREAVRRALTDDEPYIIACREALALPHDDTALKERLRKERERIAFKFGREGQMLLSDRMYVVNFIRATGDE